MLQNLYFDMLLYNVHSDMVFEQCGQELLKRKQMIKTQTGIISFWYLLASSNMAVWNDPGKAHTATIFIAYQFCN